MLEDFTPRSSPSSTRSMTPCLRWHLERSRTRSPEDLDDGHKRTVIAAGIGPAEQIVAYLAGFDVRSHYCRRCGTYLNVHRTEEHGGLDLSGDA